MRDLQLSKAREEKLNLKKAPVDSNGTEPAEEALVMTKRFDIERSPHFIKRLLSCKNMFRDLHHPPAPKQREAVDRQSISGPSWCVPLPTGFS
jgi:hypothetical protein